MTTQLVKGLVVIFFFDMSQLVNYQHSKQRLRSRFEYTGNSNLILCLHFITMNAINVRVQAERIIDQMYFVVVDTLLSGAVFFI